MILAILSSEVLKSLEQGDDSIFCTLFCFYSFLIHHETQMCIYKCIFCLLQPGNVVYMFLVSNRHSHIILVDLRIVQKLV